MTYLVDGNNVMGQRVGWHRNKAGARRRLIGELAMLAGETGEAVEVVFDGAPDALAPNGACRDGVVVYYAAPGSDADTRIRQLVNAASDRDALTVVTSDRRLADDILRAGVQVERSGVFRRRLDSLVEDGPSAEVRC